jgi:glycosyltransferase involved in cell wall biosynthesis
MRDYGKKITSSSLVSVIIDTFYRPKMLENAVTHILDQTYKNIELIIVNNGATKETIEYIESIIKTDTRIKVVNFNENQFSWDDPQKLVRICFNAGLDACIGDLVFYQSDDDWIEFDFIERMVKLFINNDQCITAIGRVANAKPSGEIINYYPIVDRPTYVEGLDLSIDFITKKFKINQENPGHSFVIKRDILNKYGRFQDTFEKQQILGIVPFGISGFDPEAIMYWGRHDIQLNSIGTKRLIFWDKYMLKNIESQNESFINIWKLNFGAEYAQLMEVYCHSVILSGYYQIVFSYLFAFKFYGLSFFLKEYRLRLSKLNNHHKYIFKGFIQAFLRSKLKYILSLFKLFIIEFISSPKNTFKKTKFFLKSKILN